MGGFHKALKLLSSKNRNSRLRMHCVEPPTDSYSQLNLFEVCYLSSFLDVDRLFDLLFDDE